MMGRRPAILAALAMAAARATAVAQAPNAPPPYAELRADALVGRNTAAQAGAGVAIPLGVYVRLGIDGAAGATWVDARAKASGRVDAVARFLLDPLREVPIGFSLGGGISAIATSGDRVRPYLVTVVDIEGRVRGPLTPAVQVGLGGGTRVGLVLRTSPPKWR